jgi:type I restriction enzyme S subunit
MVVSTGFATLKIKDKVKYSSKYLYYALTTKSITDYLHRIAKNAASSYPSLTPEDLEQLEIDFPDTLDKQNEIADFLSLLDLRIENNRFIYSRILQSLQDIFAFWFIQFDFPDQTGKPYSTSGGSMRLEKSLGRKIPSDWKLGVLSDIVSIGSGYSFKSDSYLDTGRYKIVTIKNVQDNFLNLESVNFVNELPANLPEKCRLSLGDILISLTGNVGRVCLVDSPNLLLNQRVGVLQGTPAQLVFAYLFFNRAESRKRIDNLASGSSQDNLSPLDLTDDEIVIPDGRVLEMFYEYVRPFFDKLVRIGEEQRFFAEKKSYYLEGMLSGSILFKE